MKNRTVAAAALIGIVAPVGLVAQAHAEDPQADHQPCVANREAHSDTAYGMTRTDLERRWEVTGKGIPTVNALGWPVIAYPWCDHQFHNHSSAPYEYVGVVYSGRDRARVITWQLAPVSYDGGQQPDPIPVDPTTPPVDPNQPCTTKCPGPIH